MMCLESMILFSNLQLGSNPANSTYFKPAVANINRTYTNKLVYTNILFFPHTVISDIFLFLSLTRALSSSSFNANQT